MVVLVLIGYFTKHFSELSYNPGQKVLNKFTKLCMVCLTIDFLLVFNKSVKSWVLGVGLGTCHQIQAFRKLP